MQEQLVSLLLVVAFAFAGFNIVDQSSDSGNFSGNIVEVVDGDTVKINTSGEVETVRLLGIDTPEKYSAVKPEEFGLEDTENNRNCLEKAEQNASNYLEQNSENIEVVFDSRSDRRGSYGRLLAYLENNGADLNYMILEKGYARVYESSFTRKQSYYTAVQSAKQGGRGIWSCVN